MASTNRRPLAWLVAVRAIVVTLLLGSGLLVQLNAPGAVPLRPFFFLVGLSYALTAVHALTLGYAGTRRWVVDAQIALDTILVSLFVVATGGVTSYVALLYVLPIIAASTMDGRRGAVLVAVLSSLLYAALVLGQYESALGWLAGGRGRTSSPLPPAWIAQVTVAVNIFAYLAVAALSGSLAENLRRAGASLAEASTEIANLQAYSQDIIESLTSGLVTADGAGQIRTFNPSAAIITGCTAAEAAGRHVADVLQLPPEVAGDPGGFLAGARSRRIDFPFRRPDGRTIEIGAAVAPLLTPGGKAGFVFTFLDVTETRRLERDAQVRQRLAAVGEMAAGIAHEIRNPLASMAGSMQVLREELPLSGEQAQLMDIVLKESARLNETIREFLAYARPQRSAVVPVDLCRVVSDTAALIRNSADVTPAHRIEVETPASPIWYEADEGQIRQILWNLSTNGLRAMPDGGRLRLAAAVDGGQAPEGETRSDVVVLEVEDEGVGIPPEELDGIFQPFHGTFARGSGLGLAIVHRIVSDYGGEIQVRSSVGHGTTISVRFGAAVKR